MRRVIEQLRLQSRRKLQLLLGELPHTYLNLSYYLTNLGLTSRFWRTLSGDLAIF